MRLVRSDRQPAAEGLLPTRDRLEGARHLASRFPEAGLREVLVVPSPVGIPGAPGVRAWLALESMQVTGSFKVRGALHAIAELALAAERRGEPGPLRIVAASAGNHGAGVAYAAKIFGASATVVVPRGAPRTKVDKIAGYGARVVEAASTGYDDAEIEAIAMAAADRARFVSPYDDLDVLVGNGASLGFEIVRALGKVPDAVLAPIGGGGLATGLACALSSCAAAEGAGAGAVFGVQSEASCAFAQSLERGAAVTALPPAETLAEGLEGGISAPAFARARAVLAGVLVVTEEQTARAMSLAYRDLGLVLEGSAAVALAALLAPELATAAPEVAGPGASARDVVLVLTGRNLDPERLAHVVC